MAASASGLPGAKVCCRCGSRVLGLGEALLWEGEGQLGGLDAP